MDSTLLTILFAASIASLADLFGWIIFLRSAFVLRSIRFFLAFVAGVLLSTAFLELIPEGLEAGAEVLWVLVGIVLFYLLEKGLTIYHCHDETCAIHSSSYLITLGDFIHDFSDGVVIAVSFLVTPALGFLTTLAVVIHEIPSGFGSFTVLLANQASKRLLWTFVISSTIAAPLGALLTFLVRPLIEPWLAPLLLIAAGGFIYIAATDLIPETHKEYLRVRSVIQVVLFLLGVASIYLIGSIL